MSNSKSVIIGSDSQLSATSAAQIILKICHNPKNKLPLPV